MKTAYATHRPVENSYLVRERDRQKRRELLRVLGVVLILGLGLLAYTWIHVDTLRIGYRIESKKAELAQLLELERRLRLDAANREHPSEIGERAREELDMVPPQLGQMLFYEELRP